MATDDGAPRRPPTRTFKPRRRALRPARQALFDRLAPEWVLDVDGPLLDLDELFGRSAPRVLEIGIGAGETTSRLAVAEPELDVIGVDVHTPGIASALKAIDEHQLTNVRLVHGDVLEFLPRLPPHSLDGIRIFFPDPWPKARQQRRRLVTTPVLDRLVPLLGRDGWVHLATDIADYAQQIEAVCGSHPGLRGGVIERPPWRPVTRYERRGLDAGRHATDLWYTAA